MVHTTHGKEKLSDWIFPNPKAKTGLIQPAVQSHVIRNSQYAWVQYSISYQTVSTETQLVPPLLSTTSMPQSCLRSHGMCILHTSGTVAPPVYCWQWNCNWSEGRKHCMPISKPSYQWKKPWCFAVNLLASLIALNYNPIWRVSLGPNQGLMRMILMFVGLTLRGIYTSFYLAWVPFKDCATYVYELSWI